MSERRTIALFLLALMVISYTLVALMAATSGFYSVGASDLVLSGTSGIAAALVPALIAALIFVELARKAPSRLIVSLFILWFGMAVVSGLLVHWYWAAGLMLSAAIPLLLVWPSIRATTQEPRV
jgi:hypothetical protein